MWYDRQDARSWQSCSCTRWCRNTAAVERRTTCWKWRSAGVVPTLRCYKMLPAIRRCTCRNLTNALTASDNKWQVSMILLVVLIKDYFISFLFVVNIPEKSEWADKRSLKEYRLSIKDVARTTHQLSMCHDHCSLQGIGCLWCVWAKQPLRPPAPTSPH